MAIGGSFNKKSTNAYDQRAAGSDQAQVANLGGLVFNGGGSKAATPINYVPWIIGAVVAFMVWSLIIRK